VQTPVGVEKVGLPKIDSISVTRNVCRLGDRLFNSHSPLHRQSRIDGCKARHQRHGWGVLLIGILDYWPHVYDSIAVYHSPQSLYNLTRSCQWGAHCGDLTNTFLHV
jgi:hypothetical protein